MLDQTITHYCPWDESDDTAYCGRVFTATDTHSLTPTCAACAARLDAEDAAFADVPLPLDADEAPELDPLLNAGVPARPAMSPMGAELFALARSLNLLYLVDEVAS